MESDKMRVYATTFPFDHLEGNLAVFTGLGIGMINDQPVRYSWGDDEGNRPIEVPTVTMDKKYWELLGKPEEIVVGFGTQEGWDAMYREAH